MSDILNKAICLSLNRKWQPIQVLTIGEAVTAMSGGISGHPAFGMDVDFALREDRSLDTGVLRSL